MPDSVLPRIAAGDGAAIRDLVSRHGDLVWDLCRRRHPDAAEAAAAAEDVFLDLRESAGRFSAGVSSEAGFVAAVARRRLLDRERRRPADPASLEPPEDVLSRAAVAAGGANVPAEAARAVTALGSVREEERQILVLTIHHGLTPEEIAGSTRMPLATVRAHARRGLARLAERLAAESSGGGSGAGAAVAAAAATGGDGDPRMERLLDLLAGRAVETLAEDERTELDALLAERPAADAEALDRAAAALVCGLAAAVDEPCPEGVARRVEARLRETLPKGGSVARESPGVAEAAPARSAPAWYFAAAAALLAVAGWWPAVRDALRRDDPASGRDALLARAPDAIRAVFFPLGEFDGAAVTGDCVWSDALQAGFLRFRGLKPNDAAREQYQLWIHVPNQAHPIDGGVFDAQGGGGGGGGGGGDLVVPIGARLPVAGPTAFTVTVEKPGGVVVSDRSRLVLRAEVGL